MNHEPIFRVLADVRLPIPAVPTELDGTRRVADGVTFYTAAQAAPLVNESEEYLTRLWNEAMAELNPAPPPKSRATPEVGDAVAYEFAPDVVTHRRGGIVAARYRHVCIVEEPDGYLDTWEADELQVIARAQRIGGAS